MPSSSAAVSDDPLLQRGFLRTAIVHELLRDAVARLAKESGHERLDVVDAGGGTGGFAVPLAKLGHRVTVVDPNPDALAALQRRAAEAGVTERVTAVQGDSQELPALAGEASADVLLCHGVLEYVDDPAAALAAAASVLRPSGVLSLLAAGRGGAVLARALTGRFAEARNALTDARGNWGEGDPVPHRFTAEELEALAGGAGLAVQSVHGVRIFCDVVPNGADEAEPAARAALHALEAAAAREPAWLAVAAQLHVFAARA
ncbi:methyltransferase type 12 [Mangrovactinospora gilvigrisea]|uniref:Methyltransferase type 12 n=1 Tax=Mangrovactinospora gilvigrisea TaxID=1428644 RepID=A0A1J7BCU1_9ACTN|nr:methyltransferase domain-containing protein [Mangrovactinospora gilvigrisea]OIV36413.1 methyltransferase type 12 [Mangrovactinospora gilvigrisea]